MRVLVDLLTIHDTILSLGAVIWAAVEKAPGFTPEGLIAEIRRNSNYPVADWRALMSSEPLDPQAIMARLRAALDEAEVFVARMPTDKLGYGSVPLSTKRRSSLRASDGQIGAAVSRGKRSSAT